MAERIVRRIGGGTLELVEGNITTLQVDAIVNAANSELQLGAGVAGAIRRNGGRSIQQECNRIGHCPVGGAVVTGGGNLPAAHVIHAVGPIWGRQSSEESDRLLASACRESLARASDHGLISVALPSISTGVYGYPMKRAATILLQEAATHLGGATSVKKVIFCLFGEEAFATYREVLEEVLAP